MIKIISFFISTSIILAVNCIKAQHQNHRLLFYHLEKNGTFTLISDTTKKYDNETEFKISKEEHIDIYFSYRGSEFIKASYTGEMAKLKLESGKVKIPHGLGRLNASNFSYDGLWHLGNFQGDGNLKWESNTYTGSFNKSYFNGPGNFTSATETYNGNWLNDKRHGKGLLTTSEYTYDGDFYENQKHGKGTLKYLKTSEEYTGDWLNDKRHGEGSMLYENSSKYNGTWNNDKRTGKGKFNFPPKFELPICEFGAIIPLEFIGEWINDSINGSGDLIYITDPFSNTRKNLQLNNGIQLKWNGFKVSGTIGPIKFTNDNQYEGEVKNGKLEGKGILKYKIEGTAQLAYKNGKWENGMFTGKTTLPINPNGYYKGELVKDQKHGLGEMKYADGSVYTGNWKNDERTGNGKYIWPNGNIYEGEWADDAINGKGVMKLNDGEIWKCNWKNAIPCDSGEVRYLNGAQYNGGVSGKKEGNFIRYFYQGYGQFYQKFATEDSSMINDSSYVGFFNEGLPHGNGRLERNYADGEYKNLIYVGNWEKGLKQGNGKQDIEKIMGFYEIYDGEWQRGLKHGNGKMTFIGRSEETTYIGIWINDKMTGYGERNNIYFNLIDDTKVKVTYKGEFFDDLENGNGSETSEQGTYTGEWKSGAKNGFGKMVYKDKRIYEGEWENGEPNGQGTMILTNKKIQKGIFSNGKFIRSN